MKNYSGDYFHGIYAATVNPMTEEYTLDEDVLCKHVAAVANVDGIRGLLINGHAGENFMTSDAEKRRVIEVCRTSVNKDCLLIAGVNAESSLAVVRQAEDAAAAGADALLIFPPNSWALGPHGSTVINHHRIVIEASDLPVMLYQAPVGAGAMAYPPGLLSELVQMPRVVGIKEGSWEVAAYEANYRLVKKIAPHVAVMASGDEHLLTGFAVGSDGSQVSLAVIIPETIVALDRAMRQGDLAAARQAHEIIYPLAKVIYGTPPGSFATARLKTCLKLLGRIPSDATRPPIGPLPSEDIERLKQVLKETALLRRNAK